MPRRRAKRHFGELPPPGSRKRKVLVVSAGIGAFVIASILLFSTPKFLSPRTLPVVPGLDPAYVKLAAKWADFYELPLQWVLATILAESGGKPNTVGDYHVLPEGASIGLMQINVHAHGPDMAKLGVTREMLFDPDINIQWGTKILRKCVDRVVNALRGRPGDVALFSRLCYTGVNTPGAITAGNDPLSCPSCAQSTKNWDARMRQAAAAA